MRFHPIHALLLVTAALASCQIVPLQHGANPNTDSGAQRNTSPSSEPALYARDGSIVTPNGTNSSALPRRDVQNPDGSRAKILELYQRVVDERDRLQFTLAERDGEMAGLREQLVAQTSRANEFETRAKAAEQSTADLTAQNLELAGRLTTAQIRRLEAERNWLELQIALPGKPVAASMNAPTPTAQDKTTPAVMRPAGPTNPTDKPTEKNSGKDTRPNDHRR